MDLLSPLQKIITSYAYKQWEGTTKPLGSPQQYKRGGEKEDHLVPPPLTLEKSRDVSIERNGDFGWFKNSLNQFIELIVETKCLKSMHKKTQFRELKVLKMLTFKAMFPPWDFMWRKFMASEAKPVRTRIFLPLKKPLCSLEIMRGIMSTSLFAITLEIILNLKLVRAIGLEKLIESTLLVLGSKIRRLKL